MSTRALMGRFRNDGWVASWHLFDSAPSVLGARLLRSVDERPGALHRLPRACLHAKVIVRDDVQTLITSANLTEAAQERNVEAGVLIGDAAFARGVVGQFDRLVAAEVLVEVGAW